MTEPAGRRFRLGLVINPFAGMGGPLAQKGSDDAIPRLQSGSGPVILTAPARVQAFFETLRSEFRDSGLPVIVTVPGDMGANQIPQDWPVSLVDYLPAQPSTATDTHAAVRSLCAHGLDLLLFAGGDGTARDVCSVIPSGQTCLGIPAGVKMQSGVFAINPQTAASLVARLVAGRPVRIARQEVRDIDEQALRAGKVNSRFYGSLTVPDDSEFVQAVKQGGLITDELLLDDIADFLAEELAEGTLIVAGPGSTVQRILTHWGLDGTLLGVDVIDPQRRLQRDLDAASLETALRTHDGPVALLLSAIGGQGHIIGRGNQQLTPAILRHIGREQLQILAPPQKLRSLQGRPLLIDSGDAALDRAWSGSIAVICGYRDTVLYPLAGG